MELPVRRIHISSEFKQAGETHSDFSIRLGQSVNFPDDTVAFCDNIALSNSFYTITQNHNDLLYIAEKLNSTTVLCRTVQLAHQNYSGTQYAEALKTVLNTGHSGLLGTHPYNVAYSFQENNITVTTSSGYDFVIMSDDQIKNHDGTGGLIVNKNNPRSGNKVIRNITNGNTSASPLNYVFASSYVSSFLDLLGVHNVFIHSNLADNSVMTPRGLGDCISVCPISSSFGETVHHNMTSQADAINVSRRAFETLTFQLRDAFGNILETNGGVFSCSIIFMQKNI
jgi:hypothetical protein